MNREGAPASYVFEPATGRFLVHDIAITLDLRPGAALRLEIDTDNKVWITAIPPAARRQRITRPIRTNDLSAIGTPAPAAELPLARQPDKAPVRFRVQVVPPDIPAAVVPLPSRPAAVAPWPIRPPGPRPAPPIAAPVAAVLPASRLNKTSDRDKCPICGMTLRACRGAYGSEHQ